MKCQNCQQNEATIHLYATVGNERKQLDYCQSCYKSLKQQHEKQLSQQQDPYGLGAIDDWFRSLSKQLNQQNSTPPKTQAGNHNGTNNQPPHTNRESSLLTEYGLNLTEAARQGKIDPVIGRDKETMRVIEILNRRTKNNPVLIGEPGVGKTAVAEGLALMIANEKVPQKLANKEVIQLDVVALVQGTGVRGQFEERMQQLLQEVQNDDRIILFIDEVHELVGAGSVGEANLDAGNILKPALARGEIQMLGATTLNEYRIIEKDAALERRLQPVQINEPTQEETLAILKGIKTRYEDYHHVTYSEKALASAVSLSSRYIADRHLPDKAIDLLDEAGSKKNLTIQTINPDLLEKRIKENEQLKHTASIEEDFEKAAYYRDQLTKLMTLKEKEILDEDRPEITEKDMEKIVEQQTNIPVGALQEKEQQHLKTLADDLRQKVIGQDEAVDKVAKAIRRNRIGLNQKNRPIGSFLFVGPTGVGKTELAKQLAYELFGSKDNMIRFDMSEFMEKHSVAKLIGSPPGYVGYEEAGQLTERVRRQPYSLILLDEVEKAHPDVLHLFLQLLEDGRLTDSKGRTISFKDTLIIMTSNAGTGSVEASVGFGASRDGLTHSVLNQLDQFFKPEFLNRFDGIIEFQSLSKNDLLQIVDLMLLDLNQLLAKQALDLVVDDAVKQQLVELGFDSKMGARPLRRVIQEQIGDNLAEYYLENPDTDKFNARLTADQTIKIEQRPL
ncbi:ATP-dependent Clp protease ATP-binding subunit [Vagococcus intermedius]|uniref:ATP-dependent Clp protease ATP-binding subunit n=1 Tax=Vagococcus intermedius TaxID=2991418 RepID=A0AAF0I9V7_9ENTE|nr:ATP-dependent Clp protease ATP-binding subunit [Vagococcus intermedius]WEG73817.1 ATP-dependent Clp protease ATP-binding subunit [Vagococcus intermedius]WEG75902.1 ATP-dependent Clp protease ATP-binding subunit [Vagococcus intermedius]